MNELTLESGNVTLEGEVFAVSSREIAKYGSAVLSFDMTDSTGSVRVSRFLRAEDDQTIQRTQELLDILEEGPDLLMTFDGALFSELVEKITIQNNSTAIFRLINGLEIPEHFERRK